MTKHLMAILCVSALWFSPALAQSQARAQTSPAAQIPASQAPASQTSASQASASSPAASPVKPCSAAWIQAAARAQVAPNLIGCNIEAVAVPLARVGILPSPSEHDGPETAGTIISQKPVAGEPLKRGSALSLQFSTGKVRQPAQETPAPATSAAPEKPPEKPPASSAAPIEPTANPAPPSSEAAPAEPSMTASDAAELPSDGEVAWSDWPPKGANGWGSLWAAVMSKLALILVPLVVAISVIAISLNARKSGRKSAKALPHVTCEATFGPGRLVRRGPLVLGEKGGE